MEQPNSEYIDQLSGDNTEFRQKIVKILKKELPEEVEIYRNQIRSLNYAVASGSVHKLKHKISILGMNDSYKIAEQFEKNLKVSSVDLELDFDIIVNTMQEFVDKL